MQDDLERIDGTTDPLAERETAAAAPAGDDRPSTGGSRWRHRGGRLWREWIRPFLMVAVAVGAVRSAVADWNDVPTGSMKPTILEGDRIFVNKLAYDLKVPFTGWRLVEWGEPQRGDIVVFFSPEGGRRLVKRVVGIPGDRIEMRRDRLWINGQRLALAPMAVDPDALPAYEGDPLYMVVVEQLGKHRHPILLAPERVVERSFGPEVVPPGHVFVMGDNRNNSRDSRWFGFVPHRSIVGRATAVAASVDPDRYFLPRWQRFFYRLP